MVKKLIKSKSLIVVLIQLILYTISPCQGCHNYRAAEDERERRSTTTEAEGTTSLRAYFYSCMDFMVSNPTYDWLAIVDYTVLESLWHLNTVEIYCSAAGGGSTKECWQDRINAYLRMDSNLRAPARICIAHYSQDQPLGINRYKDHPVRRRRRSTGGNVDSSYARCLSSTPAQEEVPLNYDRLSFFIRNETRDPCDEEPMAQRDVPSWPYRFAALTRPDSPLRGQINSCGRRYFPPESYWSSWSRFGGCQPRCRKTRTRACMSGTNPRQTSRDCYGPALQTRPCTGGSCREDFWSKWSAWSSCVPPCDVGTQAKVRTCRFRNNSISQGCRGGSSFRSRSCMGAGEYSQWRGWSSCDARCVQSRVRICQLNGAKYNVKAQERRCSGMRCPRRSSWSEPVASWGKWSQYTSCRIPSHMECGTGLHYRVRFCKAGSTIVSASQCGGPVDVWAACFVACPGV